MTSFRLWVGATAAAGFVLRLSLVVVPQWGSRPGFNDSPYYSAQAVDLLSGRLFRDPAGGGPGAEHGPLTPVLLAPFSWGSSPQDTQRVATLLIGTATIVVLALVARRLGGERAGIVAAGLAAVYPNLWMNDGLVMSEAPGAAFVALWLLAGARWLDRPGTRRAAAWGLVGGLAALTRSELLVLVVASALIVIGVAGRDRLRSTALTLVVAAAVIGPWVTWNLVRFERPVLMTTNDGTTIRGANCDETYHGRAIGSWSVDCLILDGGATVGLETSVRARVWREEGIEYAREHASRLPAVVAARAGRLFDVHGLDHQVDEDERDDRARWASWAGIAAFWVLLPLAGVAVWRARRDIRFLLLTPAVTVVVTSLVFYAGHRIRSPAEPAIVVAAALTLARGDAWRRSPEPASGRPRP